MSAFCKALSLAAVTGTLLVLAPGLAAADPPWRHHRHGWRHGGWYGPRAYGPPVVYAPPPRAYYAPPPPRAYYAPPPVVYAPPPPVYMAPAPGITFNIPFR